MSEFPTAQELLDMPTPDEPDAETAFLVLVMADGSVKATPQLDTELTIRRAATIGDMRRASAELVHEINTDQGATKAANLVLQAFNQAAAEAEQAQANARIRSKLNARGLVVPPR